MDPDSSLEGSSMSAGAIIKDSHKESPAATDVSSSQRCPEANLEKQKGHSVSDMVDMGPDFSLEASSTKADTTIKDSCKDSPLMIDLSSSQKILEVSSTKRKGDGIFENIDKDPDISLEGSFVETDGARKDPCKDSPPVTNLLSSRRSSEVRLTYSKRRKSCSPTHNAAISNINGSHCSEENVRKDQDTLKKAAENSNAKLDVQETSSRSTSVNGEHFVKESISEVSNLDTVQGGHCSEENVRKEQDMLKKAAENSNVKLDLQEPSSRSTSVNDEPLAVDLVDEEIKANLVTSNAGGSEEMTMAKNANEEKFVTNEHFINESISKVSNLITAQDELLAVDLVDEETKADKATSNAGGSGEMTTVKNANEEKFVTDEPIMDIPGVQLEEDNGRKQDGDHFLRNDVSSAGGIADSSLGGSKDNHSMISHFPHEGNITSHPKKKLLVLDVNGLLADFVEQVPFGYEPDAWVSKKSVFKRPFCDDFLKFCFDKFHVGVWSSRSKYNVEAAIQFLMGKSASKLLFCWNQSHCTRTDFTTVENRDKPLVLKELRKLWENLEPGLPWEKGEFNESNTLLLDDSPHKALVNPANTAIFPYSYRYRDQKDTSLGPEGDLRTYLEGLAMAEDVREYVASNPFGQRPIREANPSWRYYQKVIDSVKASKDSITSSYYSRDRRSY